MKHYEAETIAHLVDVIGHYISWANNGKPVEEIDYASRLSAELDWMRGRRYSEAAIALLYEVIQAIDKAPTLETLKMAHSKLKEHTKLL